MRHPLIDRAAIALIFLLFSAPLAADDLNRIILQVNDEILTLHDYEKRKAAEIQTLLANPSLTPAESQERLAEIGRHVILQMHREMLLLSRARQLGIRVQDTQLDAAVREVQQRQGIDNRQDLERALAAAGLTLDKLRENLRREILWSQVVSQEVTSQIEITEEEQRSFYRSRSDEFRIPEQRHLKEVIVLESSGLAPAQQEQLATEIRAELEAGKSFEEVAETHREQGLSTGVIDLGWLQRDELEDALAEVAWNLKAGEYSQPIAARGGYHIVHLVGVQDAGVRPFNEVQPQIVSYLQGTRFEKELRTYLAELEDNAFTREELPPEAAGFRSLAQDDLPEDELELFRSPLQSAAEAEETPENS